MKISLDRDELELLKLVHQAIFDEVLCIRPTCLKPVFELGEKNYLVMPVQVFLPETFDGHPASSWLEVIVNSESSRFLAELIHRVSEPASLYEHVQWPIPQSLLPTMTFKSGCMKYLKSRKLSLFLFHLKSFFI